MKLVQGVPCFMAALSSMSANHALAQSASPPVVAPAVQIDDSKITMPKLEFDETPGDINDYDKYYYFVRADTDFKTAYADIQECDGYARGISYRGGAVPDYMLYQYGVAGAIGGAIASAFDDMISGSAERRRQRRLNMRTCMGFKGYSRFGLQKKIWQSFNFEEGLRKVPRGRTSANAANPGKGRIRPDAEGSGTRTMIGRIAVIAPAMAAVMCFAAPAPAKEPRIYGNLGNKDVVTAANDVGFVMFRAQGRVPLILIREPTEAERADYARRREEAFVKAHQKYERKIKQYEIDYANYRAGLVQKPEKPVEPTRETFQIPPIETETMVEIGWRDFHKEKPWFVFVHGLKPGIYSVYGPVAKDAASATPTGRCLCMGTVKFEVKQGTIVDLGELYDASNVATAADADLYRRSRPGVVASATLVPARDGMLMPDRLGTVPVVRPRFELAGKFPNYFGLPVGRLAAIPGVFAYDRDDMIDTRTTAGGAAASSSTGTR